MSPLCLAALTFLSYFHDPEALTVSADCKAFGIMKAPAEAGRETSVVMSMGRKCIANTAHGMEWAKEQVHMRKKGRAQEKKSPGERVWVGK
jgi:hypothetical protein